MGEIVIPAEAAEALKAFQVVYHEEVQLQNIEFFDYNVESNDELVAKSTWEYDGYTFVGEIVTHYYDENSILKECFRFRSKVDGIYSVNIHFGIHTDREELKKDMLLCLNDIYERYKKHKRK